MYWLYFLLFIILIAVIVSIFYFNAYGKLSEIKFKMDNANKNITSDLEKKYDLMNKLYTQIKKVVKKKDYLKKFKEIGNRKLTNYELDSELATHLETMKGLKDDYKELKNDTFNKILFEIREIDQSIVANKKFFNKNNNILIKTMHGYTKLVAKINNITVKTSYEIKEPINDSL